MSHQTKPYPSALNSLTAEQQEQFFDWLQLETLREVLKRVAAPPPESRRSLGEGARLLPLLVSSCLGVRPDLSCSMRSLAGSLSPHLSPLNSPCLTPQKHNLSCQKIRSSCSNTIKTRSRTQYETRYFLGKTQ